MSTVEKDNNSISNQSLAWSHIVELSDRLYQLAEQKNWDKLSRQQIERDRLIEQFFSTETRRELVSAIQEDIKTICDQDKKIIQMVADNREQLGAEAQHLRAMKTRIQSYLSTEDS